MSPALAGRFFTTEPPGKPSAYTLKYPSPCPTSLEGSCVPTLWWVMLEEHMKSLPRADNGLQYSFGDFLSVSHVRP